VGQEVLGRYGQGVQLSGVGGPKTRWVKVTCISQASQNHEGADLKGSRKTCQRIGQPLTRFQGGTKRIERHQKFGGHAVAPSLNRLVRSGAGGGIGQRRRADPLAGAEEEIGAHCLFSFKRLSF